MPFTANDAKAKMNALISGLRAKFNQLDALLNTPGLPDSDATQLNNAKQQLLIEINSRQQEAAFNAASATVVRQPTAEETAALQATLTKLGKDINSIATVQAVISFVNDVLSDNSQRFIEIAQTIKKS
jgi:DNA-binding PucR family transcriptional regulator